MSLAFQLGTYTEFTPEQKATMLAILHLSCMYQVLLYSAPLGLLINIAIDSQRAKRWHNRSKFKQLTSLS